MGRTWSTRGCCLPRAAAGSLAALMVACGAAPPERGAAKAPAPVQVPQLEGGETFEFPDATWSPRDVVDVTPQLAPFFSACRLGDAALARVAERFARRQADGRGALDVSEISFALRAEGSPYVWPRAWTLEGIDLTGDEAVTRLKAWLATFDDGGERRCGVALVARGQRRVLAAVAVDALADLEPLPTRLRSGSWVELKARVLVPTTAAKVLVMAPEGAPYAVPTSFDGAHARARFRVDRPGAFSVQLLADVLGGPRPVLEAKVYADAPTPRAYFGEAAPGEPLESLPPGANLADALLAMINRARQREGCRELRRDPTLDAIAERHAKAMRDQKRIAHDAGDGDPQSRVEAAALGVVISGENVAHALDVAHAHRALWASPSHRENLIEPRFDRVGIGLAVDADGSIWVCELFADFPDAPGR